MFNKRNTMIDKMIETFFDLEVRIVAIVIVGVVMICCYCCE